MFAAFIGGLILNIMPCVLPVLSLKLMGVMKHGGGDTAYVRKSFLASTAGILFSFLVLAAIIISLKQAGNSVGWGFHFQKPEFIIFLVIVINLFAANQWGLFEFRLPQFLGNFAGKPSSNDSSLLGNFTTGIFVTILATPCSAPYLGTAVGFALSRGAFEIFLIFTIMGFGLAFPYIIFALAPKLITKLPRPGNWMLKVKYFMGYLLIATSIWLLWVFTSQTSLLSTIILATTSILIILFFWMIKKNLLLRNKFVQIFAICATLYIAFTLPLNIGERHKNIEFQKDIWVAFDEKEIDKSIADGKVVFVDVTADWCITCKFNKLNVLSTDEITKIFASDNVIAMKADYTSPDENIKQFLERHGRYGIPFNIVYGPSAKDGIPLSEILTKNAVITAIKNAR